MIVSETARSAHKQHEAAMLEAHGLKPSSGRICPRVVAGKRCRYGDSRVDPDDCVCMRYLHLLDHGRLWMNAEGQHVLTGEPYGITGEALAPFLAEMASLNLEVTILARSPWYQGHTVLIMVEPDPRDQRRVRKSKRA